MIFVLTLKYIIDATNMVGGPNETEEESKSNVS
jgi:hypothetical protein